MTDADGIGAVVRTIGWTLVASVWQGALIAGVVAVLLRILRSAPASTRYLVACVGLVLMASAWAGTALYLGRGFAPDGPSAQRDSQVARSAPDLGPEGPLDTTPAIRLLDVPDTAAPDPPAARWRERLDRFVPWLVPVWLVGVALLSVRLAAGCWGTRRLRRIAPETATSDLQDHLTRLSARLGIRRVVEGRLSSQVQTPATIGWLRPLVLVPASVVAGLTPSQLEAVLAHELAHIRRHDYAVNAAQSAIEIVLFYHPACWWLSRLIRAEREHCCDDVAVAVCGDGLAYAEALADLEARRGEGAALALTATGGSLLERINRILGRGTAGAGTTGLAAAVVPALASALALVLVPAAGVVPLSALVQTAVPTAGRAIPPGESVLQGRIVDAASARPVRDAAILAVTQGEVAGQATTDDDGRYEIRRLRPGRYTLTVRSRGYVEAHYGGGTGTGWDRTGWDQGAAIDLSGGRVTSGIDVGLQSAGTVSGHIWDLEGHGLGGVEVQLLADRLLAGGVQAVAVNFAQTVSDGSYQFAGVVPGEYFVQAYVSGDTPVAEPGPGRVYALTTYPGVTDRMVAQRLRVYGGQDLLDVDFALGTTRLLRVSGTVLDPNEPLGPGVRVGMRLISGVSKRRELTSTVDGDGRFQIDGLVPGEYVVMVGDRRMTSRWMSAASRVVVHEDVTGLELRASLGAQVEGRVVRDPAASGALDLTAVRAGFSKPMPDDGFSGGQRPVAPDGSFAFEVPAGPVLLNVEAPKGWIVRSIGVDGADIGDEPVDLGHGRRSVDVVLTDKAAAVGGLVVDRNGQPLANFSVLLFPSNRAQWHVDSRHVFAVRSRADGRFDVDAMPGGDYLAVAVPPLGRFAWHNNELLVRLESRAERIRVSEGQRLSVSIRASPLPDGLLPSP